MVLMSFKVRLYSYSCYKKNWLIFSPEEVFQCAFYKNFNSSSFRGNSPFTDDDDKGQWASFFIKIKYLNLMQAIKMVYFSLFADEILSLISQTVCGFAPIYLNPIINFKKPIFLKHCWI